MPVEQVDRDAVTDADKLLFIEVANKADHDEEIMAGHHFTWEVAQVAAHRIAAEQGGREQERAAVVAWLRSDACIWMVGGDIANEIEAEEHLK